jgi:malonate transporter MadL subunit
MWAGTPVFQKKGRVIMIIYGVALLAGCYMAGNIIGDVLGALLGVKANIGGVGFAMLLLIIISTWAIQKGYMKAPEEQGIKFWSAMYIPIVVAMSSIQNVAAALSGGVVAVLGGVLAVAIGFLLIPVLSKKNVEAPVSDSELAKDHK